MNRIYTSSARAYATERRKAVPAEIAIRATNMARVARVYEDAADLPDPLLFTQADLQAAFMQGVKCCAKQSFDDERKRRSQKGTTELAIDEIAESIIESIRSLINREYSEQSHHFARVIAGYRKALGLEYSDLVGEPIEPTGKG